MCLGPGVCSLLGSNLLLLRSRNPRRLLILEKSALLIPSLMVIKLITYLPDKVLLMLN